jgi:putative transposase
MLRKDPFVTGEYYHIYNRGIDKRTIVKSKADYERLLMLLYVSNSQKELRLNNLIDQQHKTFQEIFVIDRGETLVSIGAWCLMTNHFHLVVKQEVDGGITKFMRKLGVGYSMFFNIKYQRQGALFGGPFKSKCLTDDDTYLRHLFAYVHLNPLDIEFSGWEKNKGIGSSQMKKFLEQYRYSSYQEYAGEERIEENILHKKAFPDYFQTKKDFKSFLEEYIQTKDEL